MALLVQLQVKLALEDLAADRARVLLRALAQPGIQVALHILLLGNKNENVIQTRAVKIG